MRVMLIAAALLVGCESSPEIRTNLDPSANLASYRTYGFVPQPGTNRDGISTPLTSQFEIAVSREMESRGYRKADSNPDLLVNFNASVIEKTDIRSTPGASSMYYGPAWGYRGGSYYGYRSGLYGGFNNSNDIQTVRYKHGTANVDMVDARGDKLVWEGVAEGEISSDAMNDPQAAVNKVVGELFVKFPGRAAG